MTRKTLKVFVLRNVELPFPEIWKNGGEGSNLREFGFVFLNIGT